MKRNFLRFVTKFVTTRVTELVMYFNAVTNVTKNGPKKSPIEREGPLWGYVYIYGYIVTSLYLYIKICIYNKGLQELFAVTFGVTSCVTFLVVVTARLRATLPIGATP